MLVGSKGLFCMQVMNFVPLSFLLLSPSFVKTRGVGLPRFPTLPALYFTGLPAALAETHTRSPRF